MATKHWNICVEGKVQGVYFRANTKKIAEELGVKGFVKNQPDGSVYIEAEADEGTLKKFLDWVKVGPPAANVKNVAIEEAEPKNFQNFIIKY